MYRVNGNEHLLVHVRNSVNKGCVVLRSHRITRIHLLHGGKIFVGVNFRINSLDAVRIKF